MSKFLALRNRPDYDPNKHKFVQSLWLDKNEFVLRCGVDRESGFAVTVLTCKRGVCEACAAPAIMNPTSHLAVIGAALAGLSCASVLQQAGLKVTVCEKSRGAAGRMSTRRGEDWAAWSEAHLDQNANEIAESLLPAFCQLGGPPPQAWTAHRWRYADTARREHGARASGERR